MVALMKDNRNHLNLQGFQLILGVESTPDFRQPPIGVPNVRNQFRTIDQLPPVERFENHSFIKRDSGIEM